MKNNKTPQSVELTFRFSFIGPVVSEKNLNTHIYTGTYKLSLGSLRSSICVHVPTFLFTKHESGVVPDKIHGEWLEFIHVYVHLQIK